MKFKGKIIGALVGVMFLGPIGLAFGFIIGHLYDLGYFKAFAEITRGAAHTHTQQLFFNNTFKVMGYIAKSDGHVSEKEIHIAQTIMSKMGLNEAQRQEAIRLFSLGKQPQFNITQSLFEIRHACRMQPPLLQLFLDIQLQMASADGYLSAAKKSALDYICGQLGARGFQFNSNENTEQHYHYQQKARPSPLFSIQEAYQVLGVTQQATPDEIKKAYRRLMSQNHPDKLIAKGLPPEMIQLATQKTQRIQKAYDEIRKLQGK